MAAAGVEAFMGTESTAQNRCGGMKRGRLLFIAKFFIVDS
jgi:hypothetical protein